MMPRDSSNSGDSLQQNVGGSEMNGGITPKLDASRGAFCAAKRLILQLIENQKPVDGTVDFVGTSEDHQMLRDWIDVGGVACRQGWRTGSTCLIIDPRFNACGDNSISHTRPVTVRFDLGQPQESLIS